MGAHQSLSKGSSASESAKLSFIASEYAFFQRQIMLLVTGLRGEVLKGSLPHRRPGRMQSDGDDWPAVTVAAGSRACNANAAVTRLTTGSFSNASAAVTLAGEPGGSRGR